MVALIGLAALAVAACGGADPSTAPATPPPVDICARQPSTHCEDELAPIRAGGGFTERFDRWGQAELRGLALDTAWGEWALFADGTLRVAPRPRNLYFYVSGFAAHDLVVTLTPETLADLRSTWASVPPAAQDGAFGKLGASIFDYVESGGKVACFDPGRHTTASSSCSTPRALYELFEKTKALIARANTAWRDAKHGAISLGGEFLLVRDWPLDVSLAKKDEFVELGADRKKLDLASIYKLPDGDFIHVATDVDGKTYLESLPPVTIPVTETALRGELLANQNRFEDSKGAWLGIHLSADAYPTYKNKSLAVLPNDGAPGERYFYLWTIEDMDLTRDEPL